MVLTILCGVSMIAIGLAGFFGWERMGETGLPAEMLMPVFFGSTLLICMAFTKASYRHGLYGGIIVALLGVISSIYRIHQYGGLENIRAPKSMLIMAMGFICLIQIFISWKEIQKDQLERTYARDEDDES